MYIKQTQTTNLRRFIQFHEKLLNCKIFTKIMKMNEKYFFTNFISRPKILHTLLSEDQTNHSLHISFYKFF